MVGRRAGSLGDDMRVFEKEELIGDLALPATANQVALNLQGIAIGDRAEPLDFEGTRWGQHPDSSG
jgi:hypothetical protein